MFARIFSGALHGVDAYPIEVEVDCCSGLGQISIVGLPDTAIRESCERVRAAIKATDFIVPPGKKWLVNLAPCDIRKEGPAYDLPIAVGILAATGLIRDELLSGMWMIGELGLSGSVRAVTGVLPVAIAAKKAGATGLVVPWENAEEASLVEGLLVYPVSHLMQVKELSQNLAGSPVFEGTSRAKFMHARRYVACDKDFAEVKGQNAAKDCLEIAAAGRHNLLMVGPPGSGKSMLAERLPTIMPPLEFDEALELTKLFSVAGMLTDRTSVITERPFRSPHHSASVVGLVGGGASPKPGEISLSHLGVLFLDELTEFTRHHLDNLRQPLENRTVTISRAGHTLTYPASFMLLAACNPCPCGFRGDFKRTCTCTAYNADRYWSRLSGPFLDRIDMQVEVPRLGEKELDVNMVQMSSSSMRIRVLRAIEKQRERQEFATDHMDDNERASHSPFIFNSMLPPRAMAKYCKIDTQSRFMLKSAVDNFGLDCKSLR